MRHYLIGLGIILTAISCGSDSPGNTEELIAGGNLDAIKARKQEISQIKRGLDTELRLLDSVINSRDTNKKLPLVNTFEVKKQAFKHYLELQGDVMTKKNVLIYPEMAGTLERVLVKKGDRVAKGQLLARIDDGGMGQDLARLETQAELAKTTFERQKRLWEQKIGSELQYLEAKTTYEAATSAVNSARRQLGKSTLRAPFSGIIDEVVQDQGTVVNPINGMPVFRIVNLNEMYIEVDVPESYLSGITPGKEALIYFPVLGDSVVSQVRQTGNFINPANRSFSAEIPVPNKDGMVKPNLTARVALNDYSNGQALLIPQSIISENAEGQQFVYKVQGDVNETTPIAIKTIITTGLAQNNLVEVLTGLSENDRVIMEGARNVRDQQEVQIKL